MSAEAVFKNRLDALGVPYAIGYNIYDNTVLVIKTPLAFCTSESLSWLGKNSYDVQIGNAKGIDRDIYISESALSVESDSIIIRMVSNDEKKELLDRLAERNEDLYLYINETAVAAADPSEAVKTLKEGFISFRNYVNEQKEPIAGNRSLAKYLAVSFQSAPLNGYDPKGRFFISEKGDPLFDLYNMRTIPHAFSNSSRENAWKEAEERWKADNSKCPFDLYKYEKGQLTLWWEGVDHEDPAAVLTAARDFLTTETDLLESGAFDRLKMYIDDTDDSDDKFISLSFELNVPRDKWFISYAHIHLYEPEVDALVLKYNDYIAADPFWADLIPGGSDQNIFGGS